MTTNPNWPLTVTSVAFDADPFDVNATPTYSDLSNQVRSLSSSAGRQYELDTVTAGEAQVVIDDRDESLNPTNPASPHYPNVKIYRRFADMAMWPPAPNTNGVNANLLNPNSRYNPATAADGIDPTFEVYTTDAGWGRSVGPSLAQIVAAPQ